MDSVKIEEWSGAVLEVQLLYCPLLNSTGSHFGVTLIGGLGVLTVHVLTVVQSV